MSEQMMLEILTAILLVVVFSGFIFTGMHYLAKYVRENSFPGWHAPPHLFAPDAVWYDDPPRPGEYHVAGLPRVCWVDEDVVYLPEWDRDGERPRIREMSRAGRRVCPIVKPQEPTT